MYDAALGRWHAVDPMSEKYYSISSYVYGLNTPHNCIDPDGQKIIFVNGYLGFGSPRGGGTYWGGVIVLLLKVQKTFLMIKVPISPTLILTICVVLPF